MVTRHIHFAMVIDGFATLKAMRNNAHPEAYADKAKLDDTGKTDVMELIIKKSGIIEGNQCLGGDSVIPFEFW